MMNLTLKHGVKLEGIQPEMCIVILVALEAYRAYRQTMKITSVTDAQHMNDSIHYMGRAVDIRLPMQHQLEIEQLLVAALGTHFTIRSNERVMHIEYNGH